MLLVKDSVFETWLAEELASLPGVLAVALGGSRAQGLHRPDSDWDYAVYYRGGFDPNHLRARGWPGEVFEVGGWGGGVMNGGAWLTIEGRRVDVHYRDLDAVEAPGAPRLPPAASARSCSSSMQPASRLT